MNDGFGHEVPPGHAVRQHRQVTRYLIVIASADGAVARLLLDDRTQAAEFDAGTEEAMQLINGAREATAGAGGPQWDAALAGHTAAERAAATVYVLDV